MWRSPQGDRLGSLYRLLADSPVVRTLGKARDPLGRTGWAVAYTANADGHKGEWRLTIDEASGKLLAETEYIDGKPESYTAIIDSGWTDHAPHLPERQQTVD